MKETDRHADEVHEHGLAPVGARARWSRSRLLSIVLVVAFVALAGANAARLFRENRMNSRFKPQRRIDMAEPNGPSETPAPGDSATLRVAVAPVISPEKSLRLYSDSPALLSSFLHQIYFLK